MPFTESQQLKYFTFDEFDQIGIRHGIFTRRGGYSPEPWESLNVGGTVGDDRERVILNRHKLFNSLKYSPDSIFDVWQVHSSDVVFAEKPRQVDVPYQKADIILTENPDVVLFMRFADCVPILFADPIHQVVGIAHAGWIGTLKHVAKAAVEAMMCHYGTKPGDILAGIGPSICVDHYPVGPEVVEKIQAEFGPIYPQVLRFKDNLTFFDLWEANRIQLAQSGVRQVTISGLCTAGCLNDWYSHRGENGRTGRFGALISPGKR